jgi:hypothetical protein
MFQSICRQRCQIPAPRQTLIVASCAIIHRNARLTSRPICFGHIAQNSFLPPQTQARATSLSTHGSNLGSRLLVAKRPDNELHGQNLSRQPRLVGARGWSSPSVGFVGNCCSARTYSNSVSCSVWQPTTGLFAGRQFAQIGDDPLTRAAAGANRFGQRQTGSLSSSRPSFVASQKHVRSLAQ